MPELVNIVEDDVFSVMSMTDAINEVETLPREMHAEGLFREEGVRTRLIGFEHKDGVIRFAPVDNPGDPVQSTTRGKSRMKHFETVRVAVKDRIRASELEFLNAFGGDKNKIVTGVQEVIAKRQTDEEGLISQVDNTFERMFLGATDGVWVDHEGEIITDWFTEFGIARAPTIALDLANTAEGDLQEKIAKNIVRPMKRAAKGMPFSGIGARMGEEAWDALMKNKEFRQPYEQQGNVAMLHGDTVGDMVKFAGVQWREYFGSDEGEVALAPDEIRFYPIGGQGMFKHFMSPGEGFPNLGSVGRRLYSYLEYDKSPEQAWIDIWVKSYPGIFVSRPQMLRKARSGA